MAIFDPVLRFRERSASGFIAVVMLFVAGAMMTGWLAREPVVVYGIPGAAMVFGTASCFALTALALLADELLPPTLRKAGTTLLGAIVAIMGALTIVEHATGFDLAIDWPDLHRWASDDNPHAGRMSPPTAVAFVLTGAVLLTMHRVRTLWTGLLVQGLTALILVVGAIGVASWLLQLHLVYRGYLFGQMSLATAIGFILAGTGLWLRWRLIDWYRARALLDAEESRISLNSASLLAVVVGVSLLTGFALMSRQLDKFMKGGLLAPLNDRSVQVATGLDLRTVLAESIVTSPAHVLLVQRLQADPGDRAALEQLRAVATSYLQFGFSALAVHDAAGALLARVGSFAGQPGSALPLNERFTLLLQGDDLLLRTRFSLEHDGAVLGFVLAEQRAHAIRRALRYDQGFTETGAVVMCGRRDGRLSCFPQSRLSNALDKPMARALADETGVMIGTDDHGNKIITAFQPVGRFGLGIAISVDAAELYAPLRAQLYMALVLLAGMVVAGALLVRWRVAPLARSVLLNERRLQLALESSGSAAWELDLRTNKVHLSEQWPVLLGGRSPQRSSVALDDLYRLVHPDELLLVQRKLRAALSSDDLPYDVEHRVRTPVGEWVWVHSRGKVVERDAKGRAVRMIGVNIDITPRKRAEAAIERRAQRDPATGLPNRSVFGDRLEVAMARTRRAQETGRLLALLCLHIDGLAERIRSHGAASDPVLKELSRRLADCLAPGETLARLGNDEFAVILEGLEHRERCYEMAEELIAAIQPEFVLAGITVSSNIGIAFYDGTTEITPDQLVAKARQSMYDAHNHEPNSYLIAI
jgi:diguanylate cyclase (GGDEF)-like protein/PAS domain S-box-containing protein